MEQQFGETSEKKMEGDYDATAAHTAGFVAGVKTEIRSGLNKSQETGRLALPPTV
jgi:hypothetical protein